MNNSANISSDCRTLMLNSADFYDQLLNVLRVTILTLYLIWIVIVLRIKELRKRNMVFLYNLDATGLAYSIYGVSNMFTFICTEPPPHVCFIQVFGNIMIGYMPSYSMSAVALHRVASVYLRNLNRQMTKNTIIVALSLVWLLPITYTLLHIYCFDMRIYYIKEYSQCGMDFTPSIVSIIFYSTVGIFIPNVVIFSAYVLVYVKIKYSKAVSNSRQNLQPMRLTLQLIIYIIMYELNNISILIQLCQVSYFKPIVSVEVLQLIRIFKWLHHFSCLGLLYLHPVLLKKYKSFILRLTGKFIKK